MCTSDRQSLRLTVQTSMRLFWLCGCVKRTSNPIAVCTLLNLVVRASTMALAGRGPITHVSSPLDLADTCLEVDTCTILCVFFLLFTFFHLCFGPYKLLLGEFWWWWQCTSGGRKPQDRMMQPDNLLVMVSGEKQILRQRKGAKERKGAKASSKGSSKERSTGSFDA